MKVKISNENGYPMFLINGEKFSPLLFRSNRAEKRSVSEFYSAGVRVMGCFVQD